MHVIRAYTTFRMSVFYSNTFDKIFDKWKSFSDPARLLVNVLTILMLVTLINAHLDKGFWLTERTGRYERLTSELTEPERQFLEKLTISYLENHWGTVLFARKTPSQYRRSHFLRGYSALFTATKIRAMYKANRTWQIAREPLLKNKVEHMLGKDGIDFRARLDKRTFHFKPDNYKFLEDKIKADEYINLRYANLMNLDFTGAKLRNTSGSSSDFQADRANFIHAVFISVIAPEIRLNSTLLLAANFSAARLPGALFSGADARWANFTDSDLSNANFANTNVAGAIYQPKLGHHPNLTSLSTAKNLELITYKDNPAALVELRKKFNEAGYDYSAKQITHALRIKTWNDKKRKPGFMDNFEVNLEYILFDFTVAYGLKPFRPILILSGLVFVFSFIYLLISLANTNSHIWKNHTDDTINFKPLEQWILIAPSKNKNIYREIARQCFYCFWFSLLSAFKIGFREFNIGTWLTGLQQRNYVIGATGWCRTVSGIQTIISLYLAAIAVLSFFGDPFA